MMALIEATEATYRIRGRDLVSRASLRGHPGELIVIIGPNGAGKTTLVRMLTGELRPSDGAVRFDGAALESFPAWMLAARRAVMTQAARLSFPFTVAEVIRLGVDGLGRGLTHEKRRLLVDQAAEAADIAHLNGRLYQTLSGGEQQRVQFARALAQLEAGRSVSERQILFLDEPVASLDLRHQLSLMQAARRVREQGACVIAVLHDLNLAATFADRLVVMGEGRIVADRPPSQALSRETLRDIFGVDIPLNQPPARALPFVLPQHYAGQAGAE